MLELRDVSFSYRDSQGSGASGASLHVAPGECVVLAGRSGCGKTTVLRCANGLAWGFYEGDFVGEVRIGGRTVSGYPFHELAPLVGSVFQDPRSQFFSADCLSELCFVCENLGVPVEDMRSRAAEAVDAVGISGLLHKTVFEMSGGERQLLAIASARAARPAVYALDEPSANLDSVAARSIARVIATLKAEGSSVLVAEHKLWYLREVVDRLVIIEDGKIVDDYPRSRFLGWDGSEYARRGLRSLFPEREARPKRRSKASSEAAPRMPAPAVEAAEVVKRKGKAVVLRGASLRLAAGEVTAIVGPNGSGKSTIAKILCGLDSPDSGKVLLDGKPGTPASLSRAAYYFLQDCDYQLFSDSVAKELLIGVPRSGENEARSASLLSELGLADFAARHPASLSRGQKQRLCAACALIKKPALLALDEPTSGLDSGSMAALGGLIRRAASEGAAVAIITHDYEFARDYADKVAVMNSGLVIDEYPLDDSGLEALEKHFFTQAKDY